MSQQKGRWVVHKQPRPEVPSTPWEVILWGGTGEHPYDCATASTWEEAFAMAMVAAKDSTEFCSFCEQPSIIDNGECMRCGSPT